MPSVSVVMPAFNVEGYIAASIQSVLAQTMRDWELIIVDDGATDGTAAIAQQYQASDPRIRLVRRTNGGLAAARNTAIQHATGQFLALLDSDDLWAPTFLEAQMEIFRGRGVDVVTGNAFDLGGRRDGLPNRPVPDGRPSPTLATIIADTEAVFIMSVFRRELVDRIGGFDESMRSNEDYDFWLRAAAAGAMFARNDRPLGSYRRRSDSLSASEVRMLAGILTVYRKLRPSIANRPTELALLDQQINRFSAELLAAEARAAIEAGDSVTAAARLTALRRCRPGLAIAAAALVARWAPGLLPRIYRARRARLVRQHAAGAAA